MIRKNLVAHKERNKLTSIIYSLTLGAMIFLVVCANLTVTIMDFQNGYSNSSIVLESRHGLQGQKAGNIYIDPAICLPIILKHEAEIESFGYISMKVNAAINNTVSNEYSKVSDTSGLWKKGNRWYGVSPGVNTIEFGM